MDRSQSIGEVEQIKPSISSYTWKVDNFHAVDFATDSFITSPLISTDNSKIKCRLVLSNRRNTNEDMLGIFIQLFSSDETIVEIFAFVKFYLLDSTNSIVCKHRLKEGKYKLLPETEYHSCSLPNAAGCQHFITRSFVLNENNHVLLNNSLRLSCEILSYDPIFTSSIDNELSEINSRLGEFDDFQKLLESEKFSDVKFIVGDRKVCAHKAILVSRSPVFRAMFGCDMRENQQSTVEIVDIKYKVIKEFFSFIYAGRVGNIDGMACELLMAAEKYCVAGLKALCEKSLCSDLSVDNVLERLTVADMCNSPSLKIRAIEFIVNNASAMVEKQDFAALRPDLMCEVTRGITRRAFS